MNLKIIRQGDLSPLMWVNLLEKSMKKNRKKLNSNKYNFFYEISLANESSDMREEIELIKKEYKEEYGIDLLSIKWCDDCELHKSPYDCENKEDILRQKKICVNWKSKVL